MTILLGHGRGDFSPVPTSPEAVGNAPNDIAVGDFNGDGKQDLATANDNNVTVLLGHGTGNFSPAPTSPEAAGDVPGGIAVGDFNGDGRRPEEDVDDPRARLPSPGRIVREPSSVFNGSRMINRIDTANFKAFPELSVELRPLTLFLGPNNSGKTSVIAPVRLLSQTLGAADPAVPLLFDGPFGDFGTYRDLVYGNHRGRPMTIALEVTDEETDASARVEAEFKYRTVRRELVIREASLEGPPGANLVTLALSSEGTRHLVTRLAGKAIPPAYRTRASEMTRLNTFLPRSYYFPWRFRASESETWALGDLFTPEEYDALDDTLEDASFAIARVLSRLDYVGAMRQPPERTYHQTGAARTRIGSSGENWAGLFVLDSSLPARRRTIVPKLTQWLKKAGLASDIRLNWLSDRHYEVQLQHPLSAEYENLADVGQANSQVIPVVVGGLRLPSGSTYIIEEPEIHLHPAAQAEFGDFLVDLHRREVQAIVETHSEYLLLRLQQHVAAGNVSPEDVVFYYVDTTADGKRVRELVLDHKARFTEQLDGGFFPQRMDEATRLARLRG